MNTINSDIKNNSFKPVYLLYGEEDYLKKQMKDNLIKAITGKDSMNLNVFRDTLNTGDIIEAAHTMPFFAEKRLIVLEDTNIFERTDDELNALFSNVPEYLHIIIIEKNIDKRKKLYRILSSVGYMTELGKQRASDIKKFIRQKFLSENKNISDAAIDLIFERCGNNLGIISGEIEKLICYCIQKDSIEVQDVKKICSIQLENRIFDMIEAIGKNDKATAYSLYNDLCALKEAPVKIIVLLERQFAGILQVKISQKNGERLDAANIGIKGVAPFVLKKYENQAKNFELESLRNLLNECIQIEHDIKSGKINDRTGVELVIALALQ